MVGFTNKNFKPWVDSDGKTWNLIEWAYAPAPNVIAGNNQFTKMGDVISAERSGTFGEGGGVEKKMKEAIKHYMGSNIDKFPAKKYPSTDDWFHIGAPVLHYGTLHMDAENIFNEKIILPITNKSNRDDYLSYYNKKSLDIVYKKYKEDFKKYNYKKL